MCFSCTSLLEVYQQHKGGWRSDTSLLGIMMAQYFARLQRGQTQASQLLDCNLPMRLDSI
jgi:hypothetical protein